MLDYSFENDLEGPVAGLDEVGRGPLAGPVTAAAVILDPNDLPVGLNDSKKLSPAKREKLAAEIERSALAWAVNHACPGEIARLNIIGASFLAMGRSLRLLKTRPRLALVDGPEQRLHLHHLGLPARFIVGGDGKVASIAAASILAKVYRDRLMDRLDRLFPGYGFAANKGYGAPALEALRRHGPTPVHRWSWRAVQQTELFA